MSVTGFLGNAEKPTDLGLMLELVQKLVDVVIDIFIRKLPEELTEVDLLRQKASCCLRRLRPDM